MVTKLSCGSCSISYISQCGRFERRLGYARRKGRRIPDAKECKGFGEVVKIREGRCWKDVLRRGREWRERGEWKERRIERSICGAIAYG